MKKLALVLSILFCQNLFAGEFQLKWTIEETRSGGEPFTLDEIEMVEIYHANKTGAELGDYVLHGEIYGQNFNYTQIYKSGVHCFVLILHDTQKQKSAMSSEKCVTIKSQPLPPTDIEITFTTTVTVSITP